MGPGDTVALGLREIIDKAVHETMGDSILLSGGLDTSIVAVLAQRWRKIHAYTVILNNAPAPDLPYAKQIAEKFSLPHTVFSFDVSEIDEGLRHVIRTLQTFDPMEVRNSLTVFLGLWRAKEDGCRAVMTGDASDELFAGYSFVYRLPHGRMRESLERMWGAMSFSSIPLARSLGIEAKLPFLQPSLREFAEKLDPTSLVGSREGELFGKYVLRIAFQNDLPSEVVWRTKTPIEFGSGTTILPQYYAQAIHDGSFVSERNEFEKIDHVKIRDKEHLRYYQTYRELFGPPHPEHQERRICPSCTSNVPETTNFCTTCGAYPI